MKNLILIISMLFFWSAHARVVRPSARGAVVRARRFPITTTWAALPIQAGRAERIVCQVSGANTVRLNFSNQPVGQYWAAAPNKDFPVINVPLGLTFNARSINGDSELQCLVQSK